MRTTAKLLSTLAAGMPILACAQVQPQASGSASPAPPSLIREAVTEKLTARVWAIPDGSASLVPNVGLVAGKTAVLVIDTGMGARNAQTVLRELAKVAPQAGASKTIYLVTTHVHPEHDMGAHAFPPNSKLIRSKDQIADIAAGAGPISFRYSPRVRTSTRNAGWRETSRGRHRFDGDTHGSRRADGDDHGHGHQSHARRHRGAGRRRVVLGRRGHEAAPSFPTRARRSSIGLRASIVWRNRPKCGARHGRLVTPASCRVTVIT